MKRKSSKVIVTIIIFLAVSFIILFLDFSNILYFISKNFNYDFLSIFIPNIVLIFIFLITYFLIDKRNMEKEEKISNNQQNVLNIMLQKTYFTIKEYLRLVINNSEMIEKYIIPKINPNELDGKRIIDTQKNSPFSYDDQIMKMVYDGLVEKDILNNYIEIKNLFKSYVDMRITFYDIEKYKGEETKELRKVLEEDNLKLNKLLDKELQRIDLFMKGK